MFVTDVIQGRPYQAFVPKPILPPLTTGQVSFFAGLDRHLRDTCDKREFDSRVVGVVLQSVRRSGIRDQDGSQRQIEKYLSRWRLRERDLVELNGFLVGSEFPALRKQPVWLGGPHPATAWHVGSPAHLLPSLLKGCLGIRLVDLPVSALAIVSLIRLLQVHPFADGNGRVSRFYAIWLVAQRIGPCVAFLDLIDDLWDRARFDLHGASVQIRDHDDFNLLVGYLSERGG